MLNEHTLDQLRSLRLDGMVRAIEEQATSTAAAGAAPPPPLGSPVPHAGAIEDFGFDTWDKKSPVLRFAAMGDIQVSRGFALDPGPDDKVLGERKYLAGDQFSVADITAYAGLIFANFVKLEIPQELRHLINWHERVAARPSIAYV